MGKLHLQPYRGEQMINSERIVQIVASTGIVHDLEKFDPRQSFKSNNIDSLDVFTLLLAIEEELGIKFDDEEASKINGINDILTILESHYPSAARTDREG